MAKQKITTFWRSKLIIQERSMLRYYEVPEEIVAKADGSFLMNAFLKGWSSALRRTK